jgi:hypothetical protein
VTKTWTCECLECGECMVGRTRDAAARALVQHIRATSHRGWLMREPTEVVRRGPARGPRKRTRKECMWEELPPCDNSGT